MWKNLSSIRIVKFKDNLLFFKLERKQRKKFYAPPRYISSLLGPINFLKKFDELEIKYVVLRWFENLQELKEVDLLVSDEDIKKVDEIFNSYPGIIPCDVYTVSGHFGCNYQSFPYYPPKLAKRILENRKKWKGMFWVPSTEDYFWSLLYHVVYHKGINSGFPIKNTERHQNLGNNKYYKV